MSDLVIVGGGFSGTLAAIEALSQSKVYGGIENVYLVEKKPQQEGGGIAFSHVTAEAYHETNVAAKNMCPFASNPLDLANTLHVDPNKIMPRRLLQEFMEAALAKAQLPDADAPSMPAKFIRINDEAVDVVEGKSTATVKLTKGKTIEAGGVILATGNLQQRLLPCITSREHRNRFFKAHFVENQWGSDDRKKMNKIPLDAPVLVVGTALSAFDAARSLLRNGHTGQIVLMSRHGLTHFKYPEKHEWQDISLPRPQFLDFLLDGDYKKAREAAEKEFYQLTGTRVDLAAQTIKKDNWFLRKFNATQDYLPEQVLKQWEKNLPAVAAELGVGAVGKFMKDYSSMINVLRVGAGNDICVEIEAARKRGQLSIVAGDLNDIEPVEENNALSVNYTKQGEAEPRTAEFHTVISSLGPDHNYKKINNPLWRNIIDHGYTAPHEIGVGVEASTAPADYGRLPGARHIFAAGVCAAGSYMLANGVIGPPAFSVPGMREGIRKATDSAVKGVLYEENLPRPASVPVPIPVLSR